MTTPQPVPTTGTWKSAGRGEPASSGCVVTGTVAEITTTEDVLKLLDECPETLIALMHTSGGTILSPLFTDLTAIVCTTGSTGSHVAILAREFGVPCVMGAALTESELAGRTIRLHPDGEVEVLVP